MDARAKISDEIAWSQEQLRSLERDMRRLPYAAFLLLFAFPAGYVWGGLGVLITVVGAGVITAVATYLILGHKSEYEDRIRALKKDLARLEQSA